MTKFTIILLIILSLLIVLPSCASAACPLHGDLYEVYQNPNEPYSKTGTYRYVNASTHEAQVKYYFECEYCKVLLPSQMWTVTSWIPEAHGSTIFVSDGGHVHGTSQHIRNVKCTVCQGYIAERFACDGPPCTIFMSKPHIHVTE